MKKGWTLVLAAATQAPIGFDDAHGAQQTLADYRGRERF